MSRNFPEGAAPLPRRKLEIASHPAWDDLRVFLLCARHRSFNDAADVMGLTATALIKRIETLETQLGFKLFTTLHEPILSLSGDGRALLFDIEQMERLSLNVFRRAAAPAEICGTVRIAATEGPGTFWILPRLIKFQETYRNIMVDLRCVGQQQDIARQEADISIRLERPDDPELITMRLGRSHIHAFASPAYLKSHGTPTSLADLRNHRVIKQTRVRNDSSFARILGLDSLEGVVGISTNSSVVLLYAVEQGAGIGFLPTSTLALGAPLVAVDLGINYHVDLWLTYHRQFRHSDRHKLVIAWLKSIFDPRVYACFRDEFIHPNDLVPLMVGSRENFGLQGYAPPRPFPLDANLAAPNPADATI